MLLFRVIAAVGFAYGQFTLPVEPTVVEDTPVPSRTVNFSGLRPNTGSPSDATATTSASPSSEDKSDVIVITGENTVTTTTSASERDDDNEEETRTNEASSSTRTEEQGGETNADDEDAGTKIGPHGVAAGAVVIALAIAMAV